MERREALKRVFIVATGTLLLPSSITGCAEHSQLKLKQLFLSRNQELLLEALSDTIIPQTDTPGAKELGVHVFVAKMIDDCFDKEAIEAFESGMETFESISINGRGFLELSVQERIRFLEQAHEDVLTGFLKTVKNQVIEGYMNTEYVMTNLVPYKLVPGPFKGVIKK